jgi:hypothetical protein
MEVDSAMPLAFDSDSHSADTDTILVDNPVSPSSSNNHDQPVHRLTTVGSTTYHPTMNGKLLCHPQLNCRILTCSQQDNVTNMAII